MAFDGIFLNLMKTELETQLLQSRVEKIHQPTKEEIIIHFRTRSGLKKLLLCAKADSARIQLTECAPENPSSPTMFCMLLRKKLCGSKLTAIKQDQLERVLMLDFDGTDDLGDKTSFTIVIEIMSRYSNIIFVASNNVIIDAVKRIDFTKSSVREILPGILYEAPPAQDKLNLFENIDEIIQNVKTSEKKISKAVSENVQGLSPILCREAAYLTDDDEDEYNIQNPSKLKAALEKLKYYAENPVPTIIYNIDNKGMDFTFMPISQYGNLVQNKEFESFSTLLDTYFYQHERISHIKQRSQDLLKQINVLLERSVRKAIAQKEQLEECKNKEKYKIYGDLINSNLHQLQKGSMFYDLQNYYENPPSIVRISADILLTPSQNAQKYYKEYRKLQTAQKMLTDFIEKSQQETVYLESVLDELSRADSENELAEIKEELFVGGYIKNKINKKNNKKSKAFPPHLFTSKDGFQIRVGRNNVQNDRLTLKDSGNYDLWLHTKDIPGSHVIILSNFDDFSEQAIYDGAMLAAYFSKASDSSTVPVDYTIVKNVKKPNGAKPGRVIYDNYNTIFVTPSKEYIDSLSEKKV